MIGYITYKKQNNFDYTWFIAESAMTIGMIGTVIGFMLMLGSSFANIDPGNIDSMRKVIADMAVGMSTALLTTLTGLVVSLALKVQIIVSESVK
jgi:biopolymer transport protein ExbB/TolQ